MSSWETRSNVSLLRCTSDTGGEDEIRVEKRCFGQSAMREAFGRDSFGMLPVLRNDVPREVLLEFLG